MGTMGHICILGGICARVHTNLWAKRGGFSKKRANHDNFLADFRREMERPTKSEAIAILDPK